MWYSHNGAENQFFKRGQAFNTLHMSRTCHFVSRCTFLSLLRRPHWSPARHVAAIAAAWFRLGSDRLRSDEAPPSWRLGLLHSRTCVGLKSGQLYHLFSTGRHYFGSRNVSLQKQYFLSVEKDWILRKEADFPQGHDVLVNFIPLMFILYFLWHAMQYIFLHEDYATRTNKFDGNNTVLNVLMERTEERARCPSGRCQDQNEHVCIFTPGDHVTRS